MLSADIVGDMYRYQGVSEEYASDGLKVVDNNYLCLGSDCTEEGKDLYRIIGVTETGELKVIKKTVYKSIQWYNEPNIDIKWPDTNIYHNLNDVSNSFYSSLNAKLKSKILNHHWLYGDSRYTPLDGLENYKIENGILPTDQYIKTESGYELKKVFWDTENDVIDAPIGIMYFHDYLLAYPNGNPPSTTAATQSWIFFLNNDSNPPSSGLFEIFLTRYGLSNSLSYLTLAVLGNHTYRGNIVGDGFQYYYSVRPVFYLSSDILITGEGTLNEPFKIGLNDENNHETFEYPFKGNYETFTVFKDGTYQIELWGAQGGGREENGGLGAYTKGNIELNKNDKLYIYVGEHPTFNTNSCYATNPNSSFNCSKVGSCSGGGGATDVRLENGEWNNFDGLKSRIMVAAGGGGAWYPGKGGYGGALAGGDGEGTADSTSRAGYGATQEKYKFGESNASTSIPGNGYFSGEALGAVNAGGGSSYISGYPGCKAITKESTADAITQTESPDHYSGKVFSESVMIAGNDTMPNYNGGTMVGNTGNGYARITKIK